MIAQLPHSDTSLSSISQNLKPQELAGVISAMVASEAVSRVQVSAAYEPSQAVVDCIEAMEAERDSLFRIQRRYGVDVPLDVDLRLAGVVVFVDYIPYRTLHHRTLHCIISPYITLHNITVHYITYLAGCTHEILCGVRRRKGLDHDYCRIGLGGWNIFICLCIVAHASETYTSAIHV